MALACMWLLYGLRPDLGAAVMDRPFWAKAAFCIAVAILSFAAVARAGRPGTRLNARMLLLATPFVVLGALAAQDLGTATPSARMALWLGETWRSCPFSIAALSLPSLLFLLRALRRLAPTRPVATGFAAGLLAGGIGASAYALHCPEASIPFVATWYSLGMLTSGVLGAVLGARWLRW